MAGWPQRWPLGTTAASNVFLRYTLSQYNLSLMLPMTKVGYVDPPVFKDLLRKQTHIISPLRVHRGSTFSTNTPKYSTNTSRILCAPAPAPPAPFSGFLILGRRGLRLCLGYRFYWPCWTNMVRTQHIEGIGIVENWRETVGGGKLRPARYFPPPGVSAAHLSLICRLFSMMDRYLLAPIKWMITC